MINKKCAAKDCPRQARYGEGGKGSKAVFCTQHRENSMVDVVNRRRCIQEGCKIFPSYGEDGTKVGYCFSLVIRSWRGELRGIAGGLCLYFEVIVSSVVVVYQVIIVVLFSSSLYDRFDNCLFSVACLKNIISQRWYFVWFICRRRVLNL